MQNYCSSCCYCFSCLWLLVMLGCGWVSNHNEHNTCCRRSVWMCACLCLCPCECEHKNWLEMQLDAWAGGLFLSETLHTIQNYYKRAAQAERFIDCRCRHRHTHPHTHLSISASVCVCVSVAELRFWSWQQKRWATKNNYGCQCFKHTHTHTHI